MCDELRMRGAVLTDVLHPAGLELVHRGLHCGEVLLEDRDAGGLEDLAVALLALAQAAHDREARQRIGEPPADLLEELLLQRRPDAWIRALAEPKHVWLIAPGIEGNGHAGSDAQALGQRRGQRTLRRDGPELHGTARSPHGPEHLGRLGIHGELAIIESREFRLRSQHLHALPASVWVAWVHQPRTVGIEDRERRIENIRHHLLEIACSLDRTVHAIEALGEPTARAIPIRPAGHLRGHGPTSSTAVTPRRVLHGTSASSSPSTLTIAFREPP